MKWKKTKASLQPLIYGLLAFLLLMGVFTQVISAALKSQRQQEQVRLMERFLEFQSNTESLFYRNIALLKGYTAYLSVMKDKPLRDSEKYLSTLIHSDAELIRSIAVLQDTTVRLVYPLAGNESLLDQDLSQNPAQKERVLLAKRSMQTVVTGPVNLIQGGKGIIARVPFAIDGAYWGQVSVVLDIDKFFSTIDAFASSSNMQIALFQPDEYPGKPFYGDPGIMNKNPIILDMDLINANWKAAILPAKGWSNRTDIIILAYMGAFAISLLLGVSILQASRANRLVRQEAITDHLTGLYNRNFLEEYEKLLMDRALRNNTGIAVLLIDLDHFKEVNDKYGHRAGDEVLITVSTRLHAVIRDTEAVFRLGGDEFLFLFPDIPDRSLMIPILERIRNSIRQSIPYRDHLLHVEPSIGLSMFPEDGRTLDELMQRADEAMYTEKKRHSGALT